VFFNLFSEAEPFAAILIAHGIHVFLGGGGVPEGPKAESGDGFMGREQRAPHEPIPALSLWYPRVPRDCRRSVKKLNCIRHLRPLDAFSYNIALPQTR